MLGALFNSGVAGAAPAGYGAVGYTGARLIRLAGSDLEAKGEDLVSDP